MIVYIENIELYRLFQNKGFNYIPNILQNIEGFLGYVRAHTWNEDRRKCCICGCPIDIPGRWMHCFIINCTRTNYIMMREKFRNSKFNTEKIKEYAKVLLKGGFDIDKEFFNIVEIYEWFQINSKRFVLWEEISIKNSLKNIIQIYDILTVWYLRKLIVMNYNSDIPTECILYHLEAILKKDPYSKIKISCNYQENTSEPNRFYSDNEGIKLMMYNKEVELVQESCYPNDKYEEEWDEEARSKDIKRRINDYQT